MEKPLDGLGNIPILVGDAIVWYQQLVGQYMYLMLSTRPNLGYTISRLSKYAAAPQKVHSKAARRVLRYLNGTRSLGLVLGGKEGPLNLIGYSVGSSNSLRLIII